MANTNITWQELSAPNLNGAAATMKDVREAILGSIGGFGDVAKGYNNIVNSDAATEFQRMVANSSLDALRQNPQALQDQFAGLSTDARKLVGADWLKTAIAGKQQAEAGSTLFDRTVKDNADRDISVAATAKYFAAPDTLPALMKEYGHIPAAVVALENASRVRTADNIKNGLTTAQTANYVASAGATNQQANESKARTEGIGIENDNKVIENQAKSMELDTKIGGLANVSPWNNKEEVKKLEDYITSFKDEETRKAVANAAGILKNHPEASKLPPSEHVRLLAAHVGEPFANNWLFKSDGIDNKAFEQAIKDSINNPAFIAAESQAIQAQLRANQEEYTRTVKKIEGDKRLTADQKRQALAALEMKYSGANRELNDRDVEIKKTAAPVVDIAPESPKPILVPIPTNVNKVRPSPNAAAESGFKDSMAPVFNRNIAAPRGNNLLEAFRVQY